MKWNQISRKTILLIATVGLFVGLLGIAQATVSIVNQLAWDTPVQITTDSQDGNGPSLMLAPNGDMMIVYSHWNLNSVQRSNPYFSLSTDGGENWSAPAPILGTPNNISQVFVEGAYDAQNVAHVAWIDLTNLNSQILYARRAGNSWSAPQVLSPGPALPIPSKHVEIVASGTQTVDVVWDETEQLYHRRSTDGGLSWGAKTLIQSSNNVDNEVRIAADANGVYVVWQQRSGGGEAGNNIFFSRYDGGSWSLPALISTNTVEKDQATYPAITVSSTAVHVTYSYSIDFTSPDAPQFVVTKQCALDADCSNSANWSSPTAISNQMFVNAEDPYFIVPDMAYDSSNPSVHAYYHGIPGDANGDPVGNNEAIFGRDNCQDWNAIDQVTQFDQRTGSPSLEASNGMMHLAYEEIVGGLDTGAYRILYNQAPFTADCTEVEGTPTPTPVIPIPTRGPGDVLLPLISKP